MTIRYDVVKTIFCGQQFSSVRVDNVDYYPISELCIEQGNAVFQFTKNHVQRDLEAILGKGFQFTKIATTLNPRKINCLEHKNLFRVISHLAFKCDNLLAQTILEASGDMALRLANDCSRDVAEKAEYYEQWAAERAEGIKRRRQFTDAVKYWKDQGVNLNYGLLTLGVYEYTKVADKYKAWCILYDTKSKRNKHPFRSSLDLVDLNRIKEFESFAADVSKAKGIRIDDAIQTVGELIS